MSRLRWLFRWRRQNDDLTREMQAHVAEHVDALIEDGVDETEAWAQARREFGNVALQAERSREAWIAPWLSSVWQDLRYAVRSLVRQPGFTLGAIGMLAVAMGLVMVLATVVNATLLRPWSVPDPESVVVLRPNALPGQQHGSLSAPEFRYLRERTTTLTHLVAWVSGGPIVRVGESIASPRTRYVTSNYFDTIGTAPAAGRLFSPGDEDYGQPSAVTIVSSHMARRLFGGEEASIGGVMQVAGVPFTVIGVVGDAEAGVGVDASWMPLPSITLVHDTWNFDDTDVSFASGVFGRLAPGVEPMRATAELDTLGRQFRASIGRESAGFTLHDTRPISGPREEYARLLPAVGAVLAGLLVVLLLACANVGNLILARGLSRTGETAIRLALGASRGRVARQFLTEAWLLTIAAGAVACWIGYFVPAAAVRILGDAFQIDPARFVPDATTIAFVALLIGLTTAAAGLAPSLRLARLDLASHVGRRHGHDRRAGRLRSGLLAAQIALSMVLLIAAGLMTRAVSLALSSDPGFAIHEVQVLTLTVDGADADRHRVFMDGLDDELGRSTLAPHAFSEFRAITGGHRRGVARRLDGNLEFSHEVIIRNVSPSYFRTIGLPLVSGREPSRDASATEIVVNQSTARALWRDDDPLGRPLTTGHGEARRDFVVVGVAADVPVIWLGRIDPVVYAPFDTGRILLVRSLSPAAVQQVAGIARSLEPGVEVSVAPLANDLRDSARQTAVGGYVAWSLGGLALVLATVGAFGVFAYMVEERRREIGVRMALGATSGAIVRTVIDGARRPLAIGLAGGALLSVGAAQLLRRFLYGLSPFDPITYLGIAGILTVAALIATWIPARRATRIDPAVTLRGD